MYRVNVPIINDTVTDQTRDAYLSLMRDGKINRIMLVDIGFGEDEAEDEARAAHLAQNITFFRNAGIEADVWLGRTIGHGSALAIASDHTTASLPYQPLVNLRGETVPTAFCPLDERFRKRVTRYVAAFAKADPKIILLDDDFRLSQHGTHYCCACEKHMARMSELCGETLDRDSLRTLAFGQKANKYRAAWMKAQGESLALLAKDIRAAVDAVDPTIRVGLCVSHAACGIDGSHPYTLASILAGENNKPLLRTHGAPYWSTLANWPMPTVIEMARLVAHFCKDHGAELWAEGDVYPRPRYNIPSAILEMYDAAIRIDGTHDGILKYIVDYNSTPAFEESYVRKHQRNLPMLQAVSEMFADKAPRGVALPARQDLVTQADFSIGLHGYYPTPLAGTLLSLNSIPSYYGDEGDCHAVLGEVARHVPLASIKRGAVLDAIAAHILTERGLDVGVAGEMDLQNEKATFLKTPSGEETASIFPHEVRLARFDTKAGAQAVCNAVVGGKETPFAYRYENQDGAKFLVLCFDGMGTPRTSGVWHGYMQQALLKDGLAWISGKPLPAYIGGCPNLYTMCKGNEHAMAVALFNFYPDSVDEPIIKLDRAYANIRFLGCEGRIDGDTVTLSSPIGAYTLVAFEAYD